MALRLEWWREQINRFPLLTPAQELSLGAAVREWLDHPEPCPEAIARRGRKAHERMVNCNLRLVWAVVQKYSGLDESMHADIMQAGNEGLILAAKKYDHTKGYKFSTYAYWWIKQGVNRWINNSSRGIRLPSSHYEHSVKINQAYAELIDRLGCVPSVAEVAAHSGLRESQVRLVLGRPLVTASLDARCKSAHDDSDSTLGQIIEPELPGDDQNELAEDFEPVKTALDNKALPPTYRRLIIGHYGLDGSQPLSITELAEREHLSTGAIKWRINIAHQMIRDYLSSPPRRKAANQINRIKAEATEQLAMPLT